jgi:tol-pal system protein YbgF
MLTKSRLDLGRCAVLAAAVVLGVALHAAQAFAQSNDTRALLNRLNRLETEVQTLSRQVYRGESSAAGASSAGGGGGFSGDFEVRLSALESALQKLTGEVEANAHTMSVLKDRLDKLATDVDYRLSQLDQKPGGSRATTTASPAASAPAEAATPRKAASPDGGEQQTAQLQGAATGALPEGSAQEQYNYAFGLLHQADYAHAEQAFAAFLAKYPKDTLAENAQYWLGETYYARSKFTEAAVAFAEGYQKFPKGSKAPDNLLKLGISLAALNRKDDACTAFGQLTSQFPNASALVRSKADQERAKLHCS